MIKRITATTGLLLIALVLCWPLLTNAQGAGPLPGGGYRLSVPLPGFQGPVKEVQDFPTYIRLIYQFALVISGVLAFAMITYGGIMHTLSAGNIVGQDEAKKIITNAVGGLALLFAAVLILRTIDPNLLRFGANIRTIENQYRTVKVKPIEISSKFETFQKRREEDKNQINFLKNEKEKIASAIDEYQDLLSDELLSKEEREETEKEIERLRKSTDHFDKLIETREQTLQITEDELQYLGRYQDTRSFTPRESQGSTLDKLQPTPLNRNLLTKEISSEDDQAADAFLEYLTNPAQTILRGSP